jgi:glycosyltransferase involved in cell wall biosynthesis
MISILIPVYNRDVNQLAAQLSQQLTATGRPGEIVLLDDGSEENFRRQNTNTASLPHVRYIDADTNYGRIRIRQMLASTAKFDWLLFMDCDSAITSEQFLSTYFNQLLDEPGVVAGGRICTTQPPNDCSLRLHWRYGTEREAIQVKKRNRDPYPGFMSNNFLIHRSIFDKLSFTDDWQGYGHEDTWIGIQLEEMRARVKHIDNPILHNGLENAETFLSKSEQAVYNLRKLQSIVPAGSLKRHIKLFRAYSRLRSVGMTWLPKLIYKMQRKNIDTNLRSCNPSLFYFDLYRLNLFIRISGPHE